MQNIYSPKRFYLTFPNDDSWNFDKVLNCTRPLEAFSWWEAEQKYRPPWLTDDEKHWLKHPKAVLKKTKFGPKYK